ncbi:MAG: DNA-binding protein [Candidatus Cloacimonas sp. 4484_275]|nr:MAG: DNA-binding protein [Candidatus Cloacimonas sp. 4484_275]
MGRKQKNRIVHKPPLFSRFKPAGIRNDSLKVLALTLDEYEAVRLADYVGLDHAEAAEEMEISRSTFTRLIEKAHHKLSVFLTEGRQLLIEGGNIHFRGNLIKCLDCGHMFEINIENVVTECPVCGSKNLLDLAGGFGHGNCCRKRFRGGRR